MIRPTPRGVALFALSVPVAVLVAASRPEAWFVAFYLPCAVAVLMLGDWTSMLPSRRLRIDVAAPGRLFVGHAGAVRLGLAAPGWRAATGMEAVLDLDGAAEPGAPVAGRFRDGSLALELTEVPLRRGRITLAAVHLRWRGPLGLVERLLRHPCGLRTEVVPDVRGIHEEALRFFSRDDVLGFKDRRRRGEGAEFDKLCDFAPGMDNRFIDWKRSARHRKLLCKEFREERNCQVIVGLDTGHLMLEPLDGVPRLDHAIRTALLLGWVSLHAGDVVGGCGFDGLFRGFLQPGRGMHYFTQLQRFTAGLDYHPEETNFTLGLTGLDARLRRRGLVVLFSEFVDSVSAELLLEGLGLLARRHLVVFVTMRDPLLHRLAEAPPDTVHRAAMAVTADRFQRDRAVVLERMARLGVHCLDLPAAEVGMALLNRYLMIKAKGLL